MTFDRSEIMTKANSLRKVYGMSKSESLTKAWALVKLADLEDRKHSLDMIDCWDEEDRKLLAQINRQYYTLRDKTFPLKTVEFTDNYCGMVSTYTRQIVDVHAYDAA